MKDRLRQIINYTGLKQTEFAEKLQVQRSNISHFLSGRNKPRVDFIEKLKEVFPEINLEWLIMGTGEMLLSQNVTTVKQNQGNTGKPEKPDHPDDTVEPGDKVPPKDTEVQPPHIIKPPVDSSANEIIIIYSDKTFDTYKKRN